METCKSYCLRFTRRSNSEIEDGFFCNILEEAEDLFEAYRYIEKLNRGE